MLKQLSKPKLILIINNRKTLINLYTNHDHPLTQKHPETTIAKKYEASILVIGDNAACTLSTLLAISSCLILLIFYMSWFYAGLFVYLAILYDLVTVT